MYAPVYVSTYLSIHTYIYWWTTHINKWKDLYVSTWIERLGGGAVALSRLQSFWDLPVFLASALGPVVCVWNVCMLKMHSFVCLSMCRRRLCVAPMQASKKARTHTYTRICTHACTPTPVCPHARSRLPSWCDIHLARWNSAIEEIRKMRPGRAGNSVGHWNFYGISIRTHQDTQHTHVSDTCPCSFTATQGRTQKYTHNHAQLRCDTAPAQNRRCALECNDCHICIQQDGSTKPPPTHPPATCARHARYDCQLLSRPAGLSRQPSW